MLLKFKVLQTEIVNIPSSSAKALSSAGSGMAIERKEKENQ